VNGVYDLKRVEAEEMQRVNPGEYQRQVNEAYLRGVEEDRPAVISVNMFYATLLVDEFSGAAPCLSKPAKPRFCVCQREPVRNAALHGG